MIHSQNGMNYVNANTSEKRGQVLTYYHQCFFRMTNGNVTSIVLCKKADDVSHNK